MHKQTNRHITLTLTRSGYSHTHGNGNYKFIVHLGSLAFGHIYLLRYRIVMMARLEVVLAKLIGHKQK